MSRSWILSLLSVACALFHSARAEGGEDDLVSAVPGLTFKPDYRVYSGYLHANAQKTWRMHYMMTTSRANRTSDPVVFWFNGGPGCSSLTGSFQEMGPFYADVGGERLFENIYAWHKEANMVYMESPIGVGFSYDTTNVKWHQADDDTTVDQNLNAIIGFFNRSHPELKDRDFYLAGESYGGVYVPTLMGKLAEKFDQLPNKNFRGILVGNGYMNVRLNFNTAILWAFYHGLVGEDEWTTLKDCCHQLNGANTDSDACDWFPLANTTNNMDFTFDKTTECGKILDSIINAPAPFYPYNVYQDCYSKEAQDFRAPEMHASKEDAERNPGLFFNRHSTDPHQGYPCYNQKTVLAYFNRTDFRDAFHIDKAFYDGGGVFEDCSDDLYNNYKMLYTDMTPFFQRALDKLKNFRILVVNGDVDVVCNFLGDSRFVRQLATARKMKQTTRTTWYYRRRVGGYVQRYTDTANGATIDVLTIKGAGHMSPMDRPGPALQMFTRFLNGSSTYGDYNVTDPGVPDYLPYVDSGVAPIVSREKLIGLLSAFLVGVLFLRVE